jgi:hypothetical protein
MEEGLASDGLGRYGFAMHESGLGEPAVASLPPKDRHTLYLRLAARKFAALEAAARREGLRPWQLAQRWIEAGLAASMDGAPPTGDVHELARRLDEVERRLATLEAASPPGSPRLRRPARAATAKKAGRRPAKLTAADGRQRPGTLTSEIEAVLAEAGGGPLDYGTIAATIKRRGVFRPPRSGHSVTRQQIAARVSHRFYRDRFVRADGKVSLAT